MLGELPKSCQGLRRERVEVDVADVCSLADANRRLAPTAIARVQEPAQNLSELRIAPEGCIRLIEEQRWMLERDIFRPSTAGVTRPVSHGFATTSSSASRRRVFPDAFSALVM